MTGVGVVSAVGNNASDALEVALTGGSGIDRLDRHFPESLIEEVPIGVAAPVTDLDTTGLVGERHKDLYSRGTQYALVAAREALDDAGLFHEDDLRRHVGVVCAAAGASADLYFDTARSVVEDGTALGLRSGHAPHLSSHAAAALVGLTFGLQGPNFGGAAACATGNLAVVLGADQIRAGRAEIMLVGATESCITPLALGSFVSARAANCTDDPVGACRPFDRRRNGLVFGEGAGFLVLESGEHARARGAAARARLLGDALTNDAHHMWAPEPTSWGRAIAAAVDRSGLTADDIDVVSAHAAGTPLGDAAETEALKSALGDRAHEIPVWSSKGIHGHAFAASGAIELVLSIGAISRGVAIPTVGFEERDPDCDLDYVAMPGRAVEGSVLLKDSFGFMGTNAILVLDVVR